jgi:hypothetical protein
MTMSELTQDYIRSFLHYDPETGVMKRIKKRSYVGNWLPCDSIPKSKTIAGYLQINIDRRPYVVHRLAFVYMEGFMPDCDVDHINGDRTDNRWANLRLVDRQDNLRNMGVRKDNKSGVPGVSYAKDRSKWHSFIHADKNNRVTLGYFNSFDEAVAARKGAEVLLGFHPNHGARPTWRG